ncbi:hypothetical protein RUND412_006081 [Rhizina undulata]
MLQGFHVTIVVVLFVASIEDLLKRSRGAGLNCSEWTSRRPIHDATSPVVLVSAETALSSDFLKYATDLHHQQWLDRIFIDEVHTVITLEYRGTLRHLKKLRNFDEIPIILLAATLPPSMESSLKTILLLDNPTFIQAPTH